MKPLFWHLLRSTPHMFYAALESVEGRISAAVLLLIVLGSFDWANWWEKISPLWALLPIGFHLIYSWIVEAYRFGLQQSRQKRIKIHFSAEDKRCVDEHHYTLPQSLSSMAQKAKRETAPEWYVSLVIANESSNIVRNCQGHLISIGYYSDGAWTTIPIPGQPQFIWANDPPPPKDLAAHTETELNIFIARKNQRLALQIKPSHKRADEAIDHFGKLRLLIRITADELPTEDRTLEVTWDGTFDGKWTKDRIRLLKDSGTLA